MLKAEENKLLTEVAPGTPAGELLRRYWQPICYSQELEERNILPVKILGEELVVYRDGDRYGLLAEHCAHRGTSLAYGFVEPGCSLRCPYHGWKYNAQGRVLEQPFEPKGSTFKDKVRQRAYPVEELSGMLFAYMGPQPAPLLPRWDVLAREDGVLSFKRSPILNCNWLQAQENSADTIHTFYLHAHQLQHQGITAEQHPGLRIYARPFRAYGFKEFEWGLLKSFVTEVDGKRRSEIGNPLIFPNMLRVLEGVVNEAMHWRVPVDDEHTLIFHATFTPNKDGSTSPRPKYPPLKEAAEKFTPDGRYAMNDFFPQDWMAWETQGRIYDRSGERLGASDRGVAIYRRMLRENIEAVQRGDEPMALLRDAEDNEVVHFSTMADDPIEHSDVFVEVEPVTPEVVSTQDPVPS